MSMKNKNKNEYKNEKHKQKQKKTKNRTNMKTKKMNTKKKSRMTESVESNMECSFNPKNQNFIISITKLIFKKTIPTNQRQTYMNFNFLKNPDSNCVIFNYGRNLN